jgi:biotin carboxyl carrier protein
MVVPLLGMVLTVPALLAASAPPASSTLAAGTGTSSGSTSTAGEDARLQDRLLTGRMPTSTATKTASGPGEQRFAPIGSPEILNSTARSNPDVAPLLGQVADVRLHLPSPVPERVGFHEAATMRGLPITPFGRLATNRNSTRFDPAGNTIAGWDYAVLHSRGRRATPNSAVDVAMVDDDPVRSPVTGTVVDVQSYRLEGRYPDLRIEIEPIADPDLRVVVIHVDGVRVSVGDVVEAGETTLALTARRFPFFSQIDELTAPDRWPHVHREVQPKPPPEPPPEPPVATDGS